MDRIQKLAAGSIAVALTVLGLKFLAYHLTGSIALYSDALESIVNVVTATVALLAVRTSAKPKRPARLQNLMAVFAVPVLRVRCGAKPTE